MIQLFLNATSAVAEEGMKLGFTTKLVPQALKMMGQGMLGIFIALFIIYLACVGLKKAFPPKKENENN